MLLCCVSTNYTQYLGRVDHPPREDFEVCFWEQGAYRTNGEYMYDGWRRIDVVLKFIVELVLMLLYNLFMQIM